MRALLVTMPWVDFVKTAIVFLGGFVFGLAVALRKET